MLPRWHRGLKQNATSQQPPLPVAQHALAPPPTLLAMGIAHLLHSIREGALRLVVFLEQNIFLWLLTIRRHNIKCAIIPQNKLQTCGQNGNSPSYIKTLRRVVKYMKASWSWCLPIIYNFVLQWHHFTSPLFFFSCQPVIGLSFLEGCARKRPRMKKKRIVFL